MLLGLAFAMHVVSASDALVGSFATAADRLRFSAMSIAVLALAAYLPTLWLVSRVATPVRINQTIPPFAQGDVLWYNREAEPVAGDIVLYDVPHLQINDAANHRTFVFDNQWISRIVALEGQTVEWKNGVLLVDGTPSEWQPSGAADVSEWRGYVHDRPVPLQPGGAVAAAPDGTWVVPAKSVCILADSLVPPGANLGIGQWQTISTVPESRIRGQVFFRSYPFWRMMRVK